MPEPRSMTREHLDAVKLALNKSIRQKQEDAKDPVKRARMEGELAARDSAA